MSEARVLYRKYRSGSFAEVIGQDHIVRTLSSAIAAGRIAHAYLFTGPRGTGKTSVARLLARAANCTGDTKPCGACEMCLTAINSSLDIVEIDAASNRSIDAIRELREKVALAPSVGSRKVYIIDEAHMLTNEAFNALLKTLEEPPAHAMFILATTEGHKVPATIISRTQCLAFHPITQTDLTKHLASIAQREGITIDESAIAVIAKASRGGFRDAISMLDQLSAGSIEPITTKTVREVLGYSSQEELLELAEAMANRHTATALTIASRLQASGAAPAQTALGLIDLWRSIMRQVAGTNELDAVSSPVLASADLHRMATIVETLMDTARSHWPELALEAAIVKLTTDPANHLKAADPSPAKPPTTSSQGQPAGSGPDPATAPLPQTPPNSLMSSPNDLLSAELWPKVLVMLKAKNNSLGALLQMYGADFLENEVTIKPRFNFHRDLFLKPANRTLIEAAATKVYGKPVKISARVDEEGQKATARSRRTKPDANSELVSSALEILGGEVVD